MSGWMNEWMTYALRDDTTKWMMSTFWYPRVLLVSPCDRLHEILIHFPFSESFTIAMCFCCLSFSIPISELIMSCLAMGMLLSILWWKFEQYLHCLIFLLIYLPCIPVWSQCFIIVLWHSFNWSNSVWF